MNQLLESQNLNYKEIGNMIKKGSIIIYPTDTIYGLGASIYSNIALDNIYKIKKRSFKKPLIALLSDKKYVEKIAVINKKNEKKIALLIENFWPGGLTIILEKKDVIPANMVSNGDSVGIRVPNNIISLALIKECGGVLATTSANISGDKSPSSFYELTQEIKSKVEIIICSKNPVSKGIESTIIDMRTNPKIIREGSIKKIDIEKVIGIIN